MMSVIGHVHYNTGTILQMAPFNRSRVFSNVSSV